MRGLVVVVPPSMMMVHEITKKKSYPIKQRIENVLFHISLDERDGFLIHTEAIPSLKKKIYIYIYILY